MANKSDALEKLTALIVSPISHRVSLSVYVAEKLEELLTSDVLTVGKNLPTENELCEVFGVSRTVIREAITQLKSRGLVATRRGFGTTVIRTSAIETKPAQAINLATVADIINVLELRLQLEPAMASLAAQHHDDNDRRILLEKHTAFIRRVLANSRGVPKTMNSTVRSPLHQKTHSSNLYMNI